MILILQPMIFLSGAWNPPEAMTPWMRWVSLLSPLRYFIDFGFGVILKGNGLRVLAWDVVGIAVLGMVLFGFSLFGSRGACGRTSGAREPSNTCQGWSHVCSGTCHMRATLLLALGTVIVAGGVAIWWRSRGPDASQFADLLEPRVTRMSDQRVLVVEAAGDPNVVASAAFKLLFDTYFKLPGVSRAARPPAPRARWSFSAETPRDEWRGQYALPVPDAVGSLPAEPTGPMRMAITTWTYGEVAEVLHIGPYSAEEADIRRLLAFVDSRGYRVVGDHEEDYVKGPGMLFKGNPDTYLTIIRLRVEK